jgi:stage IV sporulation protein B
MRKQHRKEPLRRRFLRGAAVCFCYLAAAAAAALGWLYSSLPDTIYVEQGRQVHLARLPMISAMAQVGAQDAAATAAAGSYNTTLALEGVLPVKTVRTIVTQRPVVTVCGTPFGIKMFSDGALVVAFTDISTRYGGANPAKEAGLKLGDLIIRVGGSATKSNDALSAAINAADGAPVEVVFIRGGEQRTVTLTPAKSETGQWMAGIWVRDSSAGVGTLTFVDESTGIFAGLGHSISDGDTGESIALRTGEIVPCRIVGCQKGIAGSPGELQGQFSGTLAVGTIRANGATGVYGTTRSAFSGTQMEVAFSQEVTEGPAQILTTVSGEDPALYAVEIEHVRAGADAENRNLVVRVTDPALLELTGGIVQGMSGSPILQNGRLAGAVTHVLVNDPARGYGIFAQTMLEEADDAANAAA